MEAAVAGSGVDALQVGAAQDLQSCATWQRIFNPRNLHYLPTMARVIPGGELHSTFFLTLTVVDWVDVFTRSAYCRIFTDSLNYCAVHKGLDIYAWVLMSNHAHLVASARPGFHLSDILRDMKKYMSKKIVAEIMAVPESRADWMLYRFDYAGRYDDKIKDYRFWQEGNFPKECTTTPFLWQKIDYTHLNPVRAGIVAESQHYLHSSAIDYAGGQGLVKVVLLER